MRHSRFASSRSTPWPSGLPSSPHIREFYELCDGGNFGLDCEWHSIGTLASENELWHRHLTGYYPDGSSPLTRGQHLVFGRDAAGALYIWDIQTDHVTTFFFKGGDFELRAILFTAFLHRLLFPELASSPDDLWYQALRQLDELCFNPVGGANQIESEGLKP